MASTRRVIPFAELGRLDVGSVGGKNASLGEMTAHLADAGVRVPPGFATTAGAYGELLDGHGLRGRIEEQIARLREGAALDEVGAAIRSMTLAEPLPPGLGAEIVSAYEQLGRDEGREDPEVAVRSSATAEDLPEASFAGQQETYLNVRGTARLLESVHRCYASLYTDRAIDYRERMGFDHLHVALSVGVQTMVRSDLAGAGVIFTLDPESGFPEVVVISAAFGLGETVVSGQVDPDEYTVFKPSLKDPELDPLIDVRVGAKRRKAVYAEHALTRTVDTTPEERSQRVLTDTEVRLLADWALTVEGHYGCPMDLEWAKDGLTGDLWIVQARPETVQSRRTASTLRRCRLTATPGTPLVDGTAVGEAIGSGPVVVLDSPVDLDRFPSGGVLVTGITDPDWEPIMKRASAIVTDHGGRTSHAAIVSRELGVPAVVGTGRATQALHDGQKVTVSCAEGGRGKVYDGLLAYEETETDLAGIPATRTRVTSKRVLVAYGTKHGATAGIASEIGRTLREDGLDAVVVPADDVDDVRGYDAVVLGGALYAGHWSGKAKRCAERNEHLLKHRPVYLFSSGPVDSSAEQHDIAAVPAVAREMERLGAREHVTFGGSITASTPGFIARAMVRAGKGGDFRNPERIRTWAHHISAELAAPR